MMRDLLARNNIVRLRRVTRRLNLLARRQFDSADYQRRLASLRREYDRLNWLVYGYESSLAS